MRYPEPPEDLHRMARKQGARTTLINKPERNGSHNMTRVGGIVGLLASVCFAGCMNINPYSITKNMESAIGHSVGGLTDRDVAAEVFHKNNGATGRQIVLIHYSRWDFEPSHKKTWYGTIVEDLKQEYDLNPRASQTEARQILAYVLSSHLGSNPGVTNTMAVVICGVSDGAQVYQLKDGPLPTYVVSSASVEGGEVLKDAFSANLLKLAQTASRPDESRVANVFPFEPLNLDQFKLRPDYYDPINEFRTDIRQKMSWSEAMAEMKKSREGGNDYIRDQFIRKVTVSWPKLLGDSNADSDILVVSWGHHFVGGPPPRPWSGCLREEIDPFKYPVEIKCARVSAKDGVVYYYKTTLPHDDWSLERHLERMAKEYEQTAATSR